MFVLSASPSREVPDLGYVGASRVGYRERLKERKREREGIL